MSTRTLIGNRYLLERVIGTGGASIVWEALDSMTGRRVAVKLISPLEVHDEVLIARFARECEVLSRCRSRRVVRVEASGRDKHHGPYLAMELLEGETLEQRLARVGALSPAELRPLVWQVAEGLSDLHALGIVHRDLKPANIFLARDRGGQTSAKLLDFGTVKVAADSDQFGRTQTGALVGTPSRMSPEQVRGLPVDHRADVWGFAMVVFEAVVGCPAIDDRMPMGQVVLTVCHARLPVPSQFNGSLDGRFDSWFARSTALAPGDRFDSIREQAIRLDQALAQPVDAPRRRSSPTVFSVLIDGGRTLSLPPLAPRTARRSIARHAKRPVVGFLGSAVDKESL